MRSTPASVAGALVARRECRVGSRRPRASRPAPPRARALRGRSRRRRRDAGRERRTCARPGRHARRPCVALTRQVAGSGTGSCRRVASKRRAVAGATARRRRRPAASATASRRRECTRRDCRRATSPAARRSSGDVVARSARHRDRGREQHLARVPEVDERADRETLRASATRARPPRARPGAFHSMRGASPESPGFRQ